MTILLYKDGRLVIDDGNPIEGVSLEGLVACVTDPQSGDTLKFDGKQWVAGAAASGLPDVSGDDDGKVLTVVEGEWAPAAASGGGGVVVEFNTYDNGQYDKGYVSVDDAADIVALYKAGNNIVFHFPEFPLYARESYMSLVAYLPANESVSPDYTERFITAGNVGLTYGDTFVVNDNGKLEAQIYID